jgi:hypothetical protein
MASLVAHLFSCKQELIQCEDKVTRDIAENLLKELYRLEDTVKWWGYLEDTHFEQLDGIAQNIVYGQVPGYQKVDKMRDNFNDMWERHGPLHAIFTYHFNQIEDILTEYCHSSERRV